MGLVKGRHAAGVALALIAVVTLGSIFSACGKGEPSGQVKLAREHEQAAVSLVEKGDLAGAIEEYSEAIALNPDSDLAYEGRGVMYTSMNNYDLAIADLTRAVELRPDRGGPYYSRGVAYRLRGDLDRAIEDLSRAIGDRSKTRWRAALLERGLAYKAKGNVAEARADFEKIVQLEAERPGEADKEWVERARKELEELGR